VVKEVVDAFWRVFQQTKKASLMFLNVGAVYVKGETVRGTFQSSLIDQIDFILNKKKEAPKVEIQRCSESISRSTECKTSVSNAVQAVNLIELKKEVLERSEKVSTPPEITKPNAIAVESEPDRLVIEPEVTTNVPEPEPEVAVQEGIRIQTPIRPTMKMKENTFVRTDYKTGNLGPKVAEYRRIATAQQFQCKNHSHHVDNREMCYLCSQRAARNVPVYFREQEEKEERENAKILTLAEQRKAEEAIQKEFQLKQAQRKITKEYAAFNKGAAQATKEKRAEENKHNLPHDAYVMAGRPLTPHKSVGYEKVNNELTNQINSIKTSRAKCEADKRLIERLYQIQLAEGLAQERENYLRDKERNKQKLNQTYQYQIKNRIPELPKHYSDKEIFGKNDVTSDKRRQIRERNKLYASDQFLTFQRNKTARERDYSNRVKDDTEMLRRTKTDLEADTLKKMTYKRGIRKGLETNWFKANDAKYEREIEAKIGIPEKITVQEQLDHYRKCHQCTRKPQNKGESNIWKESYYTPGARIMV